MFLRKFRQSCHCGFQVVLVCCQNCCVGMYYPGWTRMIQGLLGYDNTVQICMLRRGCAAPAAPAGQDSTQPSSRLQHALSLQQPMSCCRASPDVLLHAAVVSQAVCERQHQLDAPQGLHLIHQPVKGSQGCGVRDACAAHHAGPQQAAGEQGVDQCKLPRSTRRSSCAESAAAWCWAQAEGKLLPVCKCRCGAKTAALHLNMHRQSAIAASGC